MFEFGLAWLNFVWFELFNWLLIVKLLKFFDKLLTRFVDTVLVLALVLIELDAPVWLELLKLLKPFVAVGKLIKLFCKLFIFGELGMNKLLEFDDVFVLKLVADGVPTWVSGGKLKFPRPKLLLLLFASDWLKLELISDPVDELDRFGVSGAWVEFKLDPLEFVLLFVWLDPGVDVTPGFWDNCNNVAKFWKFWLLLFPPSLNKIIIKNYYN